MKLIVTPYVSIYYYSTANSTQRIFLLQWIFLLIFLGAFWYQNNYITASFLQVVTFKADGTVLLNSLEVTLPHITGNINKMFTKYNVLLLITLLDSLDRSPTEMLIC